MKTSQVFFRKEDFPWAPCHTSHWQVSMDPLGTEFFELMLEAVRQSKLDAALQTGLI
jgi:hypothetical protein